MYVCVYACTHTHKTPQNTCPAHSHTCRYPHMQSLSLWTQGNMHKCLVLPAV